MLVAGAPADHPDDVRRIDEELEVALNSGRDLRRRLQLREGNCLAPAFEGPPSLGHDAPAPRGSTVVKIRDDILRHDFFRTGRKKQNIYFVSIFLAVSICVFLLIGVGGRSMRQHSESGCAGAVCLR